ncbi:hypothetical protein E4U21_003851 [Claviceps maximensis]|nr:hypothetical protein E4U21_003851 [Claviceps maximensis]
MGWWLYLSILEDEETNAVCREFDPAARAQLPTAPLISEQISEASLQHANVPNV